MQAAIHLLATEYGWSKKHIFEEVYPEELSGYTSKIIKQRALSKMQEIEIAGSAFGSKEYRQKLYNKYREQYQGSDPYIPEKEKFDTGAFDRVKGVLDRFGKKG